jgi:acyl transferase domain-containing protein
MLSAQNLESLKQLAKLYADLIAQKPGLHLHDICWTTATGRRFFQERLALIVASTDDLIQQLLVFSNDDYYHQTTVKPDDSNPLTPMAKAFINNDPIDLKQIFQHNDYRRLHLPSHPFQRTRCWVDDE